MVNDLPDDPAQLQALVLEERARRQQAEAELLKLRKLNPNPVLRLGGDGQLLFSNPAAESLAQELRQTGPSRVRPQLVQATVQALRTGEMGQRELTANHLHYLLFTVPVVEEGYTMLYLTDITDRRHAEREVREQQEFYETILGHLPAVVTVLDADQRYQYINPYAEPDPQQRQQRIGSTFAEHCAQQGLPAVLASRRWRLFERAVRTRDMVSWEEKWPTPEGGELYWLCFYQPVFGPEGVLRMVICYGLDITKRRQAEERTRLSEEAMKSQQDFTQQVLDLNPSIIMVRDEQMRVTYANQALRDWQRMVAEQSGSETYSRDVLSAEEVEHSAQLDARAIASGQTITSEDRITMPDGESRWYQVVRCPLTQPDGSRQVLIVSTDVTDLKLALRAAQAAATARENFLANMSHEIRTPMNGVLGMTSLLAKTGLNEQQRSYAEVIQYSGKHLLNVVNDVLDMAKITSGKLELEQAAFNLCDSMGKAVQPLVVQAQEKGIRVLGTLLRDSCPHPWVVGDPFRLNQILINLVSNAIKFTPAGGTVSIGGYFVSETLTTLTTEFRVTDTGIGIAPDKLDTIFQEFTQAYADTTRQFGGTGLGLSISRALVQQMGGTLTVQSVQGSGSSFSFITTLPKATSEQVKASTTPEALPDASPVRGLRVLLVEDNAINREVAHLLLAGHGVEVDEAESGLEALEMFEQQRYDVILMDIQMPGMNGLEATAHIRQHPDPRRALTPVLALTANAFRSDADKYRAAGMNDTLSKPFEETELLAKISHLASGTEQFLEQRAAAPAAPAPAPEPAEAPEPAAPALYDLGLLRQTAHGSTVFMNKVLASFHNNMPASIAEMRDAQATADLPALSALAHKLRPSLRLLGAAVSPWLEEVENKDAAEADRLAAAAPLIERLQELVQQLPSALE
ncbi:response regulator [Hymenobacter sp. ASUV-10]|uniref:histidine kinase n=1 Tax=Hymenobacter aranciens TaxID=3063996 RepID=A0ABT9B9D3_9BACT|nr:PAS domain-containing hybrid sensor histidine kinase/response regulator [Hymenobacter sp. ASUV-10]MDO7874879.1 response regulator [Hymenobacter sp. ASUV-10]